MILISIVVGSASAIAGHLLAITVPVAFGFRSVNSAAMMTVTSGLFLVLAVVASPKAGVLIRLLEQRTVARKIVGEDILALLYRQSERTIHADTVANSDALPMRDIANQLKLSLKKLTSVASDLVREGWISMSQTSVALTSEGHRVAQNLIRSHRLWEQYLSVEVNASDARLHAQAESLEHFTNSSLRGKLDVETGLSTLDPHGRSIPPEG